MQLRRRLSAPAHPWSSSEDGTKKGGGAEGNGEGRVGSVEEAAEVRKEKNAQCPRGSVQLPRESKAAHIDAHVRVRAREDPCAELISERVSSERGHDVVLRICAVFYEGAMECACRNLVGAGEEGADAKLRGYQDASSSRAVSGSAIWSRPLVSLDAPTPDCDMGAGAGKRCVGAYMLIRNEQESRKRCKSEVDLFTNLFASGSAAFARQPVQGRMPSDLFQLTVTSDQVIVTQI